MHYLAVVTEGCKYGGVHTIGGRIMVCIPLV
jgi:hypothetical protein